VIIALPGATNHHLYPYALMISAALAADRGEFDHVEDTRHEALQAAQRLSSGHERRRVESMETATQGIRLAVLGQWRESVPYWEQMAKTAQEDGRKDDLAQAFISAANSYTMAATPTPE
jgi:hypothetical protein